MGGNPVNTTINFSDANGYHYYLNNGANFLLFNFVKRWHWLGKTTKNFKVDVLAKAGIGPVIPHVDSSFLIIEMVYVKLYFFTHWKSDTKVENHFITAEILFSSSFIYF